jgi:transcriptional regulator with XRE-family HTH domain
MDWNSIIAEIQAHGYSQPQIASACGCAQATISDLASGNTKDPRHSLGQAIEALLQKLRADRAKVRQAGQSRDRRDPNQPTRRISKRSVEELAAWEKSNKLGE